jgi:hypothetical protein
MKQGEFNFEAGERAKKEGMELATDGRQEILALARRAVKEIALKRTSRQATADDAQAWLILHGYKPSDLGMAAGSIFTTGEWVPTGKLTYSKRVSSHLRPIQVWRLK